MIETDADKSYFQKAGEYMPTGLEVTKAAMDDFKKIQRYMVLAKKENAAETYAELKREYIVLKAILQVAGVNMTDIDEIKEQQLQFYESGAIVRAIAGMLCGNSVKGGTCHGKENRRGDFHLTEQWA